MSRTAPTSAELRRAHELEQLRALRDQRYRTNAAFVVRQLVCLIVCALVVVAPDTGVLDAIERLAALTK